MNRAPEPMSETAFLLEGSCQRLLISGRLTIIKPRAITMANRVRMRYMYCNIYVGSENCKITNLEEAWNKSVNKYMS